MTVKPKPSTAASSSRTATTVSTRGFEGTTFSEGSMSDSGGRGGGSAPAAVRHSVRAATTNPASLASRDTDDFSLGAMVSRSSRGPLADQPGHDHHRGQRDEPGDDPLGDRANVL